MPITFDQVDAEVAPRGGAEPASASPESPAASAPSPRAVVDALRLRARRVIRNRAT